ncbi:molecular chaperone MKKS [Rhinophrynus dorsalis]
MSRFEPKKPSLCTTGPLGNKSMRDSLSVLHGIIISCYGPSGRLKQIHNGSGGCVLTTSQSSALLSSFSVSHPVTKLLIASIRNHISRFTDCGLFSANLCCNLVERFLTLNVSPNTIIKTSRSLLNMCISYLRSDECSCKMALDFNSSKPLLCLARSVVSSKPACMLTNKEADYVSTLIVKAFLYTVPNEMGSSIVLGKSVFVPVEGHNVMESTVESGLLIELPKFSWSRAVPSTGLPSTNIKMALFSVSLSGEFCDTGEGTVNMLKGVDPEIVTLEQLLILGKTLVDDHVNFLVCQKVIHPSLKQYLKQQNILAVDRLGAALMEPMMQMTGAQPIASLSSISSTCYGSLRDISRLSLGSKLYLHLIPFDTSVCSFVVCNRNETSLRELMRTCQTAEHVLQLTLKNPWALMGGGCTEAHLASYVRYKSANIHSSCLEELKCSAAEYQLVADCFCISLESVARSLEHDGGEILTDLKDGHFWSVPPNASLNIHCSEIGCHCGCGILRKRESLKWSVLGSQCEPFNPQSSKEAILLARPDQLVLDCFTAKCNGLQVAVDTAGLILELSYMVEDQN